MVHLQARKALKALKGLVKIQALVRGYLVRKRAAATLHSMQALIRAQAAVRSQRARRSMNNDNNRFQAETRARKSIVRMRDSCLRFINRNGIENSALMALWFLCCRRGLTSAEARFIVRGSRHRMMLR